MKYLEPERTLVGIGQRKKIIYEICVQEEGTFMLRAVTFT